VSKRLITRTLSVPACVALALALVAAPAAGNAPETLSFFQRFTGVNACTGQSQTVTVTGTLALHDHDGMTVATVSRNVSTSEGFVGRGTSTLVVNGQVQKLSVRDMLTHESGARMRAGFILVIDSAKGTVKVVHGGVACVSS
jgi:hypothetical protein